MQKLFASAAARANASAPLLQLFTKLLALEDLPALGLKSKRPFYRRAWGPLLTLWYLIWQRLSPQHTLAAVVADARRGGADALRPGPRPLSTRLRSSATTAFAKARARLPLAWVQENFTRLAQALAALAGSTPEPLPVRLLDGSTLRLRPHGDIPNTFPRIARAAKNPTGASCGWWCVFAGTAPWPWPRRWARSTPASRRWRCA